MVMVLKFFLIYYYNYIIYDVFLYFFINGEYMILYKINFEEFSKFIMVLFICKFLILCKFFVDMLIVRLELRIWLIILREVWIFLFGMFVYIFKCLFFSFIFLNWELISLMIFLIDLVKVFLKLVLMLVKLCIVLSVDLCLIVFLYVGFIFFFVRVICCSVKFKIDMYFFVGFI